MVLLCVCFTFSICISVSSHFCAPIFTFLDSYHSVRPFVWGFVLILVRRCFVFDICCSSGYCQWLRSYKSPGHTLQYGLIFQGICLITFGFESAHLTSGLPFVLFPKRMFLHCTGIPVLSSLKLVSVVVEGLVEISLMI